MGFRASIASSNVGDQAYSPLWRIIAATWQDPNSATFLTNSGEISEAAVGGLLKIEVAGVVVNCPFVEIN